MPVCVCMSEIRDKKIKRVGGFSVCVSAAVSPNACLPITVKKNRRKKIDTSTTSEINRLRAIANTSCIILWSKGSHMTRSPAAHQRFASNASKCRYVRSETSGGTYRSTEPAALSEAPQPRKLTTSSASGWHLCALTTLTPKPLNKQSTSFFDETNKKQRW